LFSLSGVSTAGCDLRTTATTFDHGEFIGTTPETGSDEEQRADTQQAYEAASREAEVLLVERDRQESES
jgi:hypothetical protein